jgi:hypothetical protein
MLKKRPSKLQTKLGSAPVTSLGVVTEGGERKKRVVIR